MLVCSVAATADSDCEAIRMGTNLGKQIGPLPLGAWVAVVGGGLALGYIANKRMGSGEDTQDTIPTDPNSDVGVGGGQFIYEEPSTVSPGSEVENTNQAWGVKATNYLVSLNINAVDADNTIRKYLSSMQLTVSERAMVNLAIIRFGAPPEPLSPTDDVPTGPPSTPPPSGTGTKPAEVTNLTARPINHGVTFTWGYSGPPIAGFRVTVTALRTGHKKTLNLTAHARSYTYRAPGWSKKTNSQVQIYVRPFRGGFLTPDSQKVFSPMGRGATAKPII